VLPTINSNLGVSFPLVLSGWMSISYPVDVLIKYATMILPRRPRPTKQIRTTKRRSVERLGMSIACRYTPSGGFQFRVTPWLFLLPGIQLIAEILARLTIAFLGQMEQLEAQTYQKTQEWYQKSHPQLYTNTTTTTFTANKPSDTDLAVRRFKVSHGQKRVMMSR